MRPDRVLKASAVCSGQPSQNSASESGRCTGRAARSGRSETSGGQRVRTCSSTDAPCRLSAVQHSELAHRPVRAA